MKIFTVRSASSQGQNPQNPPVSPKVGQDILGALEKGIPRNLQCFIHSSSSQCRENCSEASASRSSRSAALAPDSTSWGQS